MLIAVDVDDVLADWVTNLALFHNQKYGTKLKREDFNSFYYRDIWGGTQEEAIDKVDEFYVTPFFLNILPLVGAKEGIDTLKEKHELVIVTSRPTTFKKETVDWLEKHFPKTFKGFHFTNLFMKGPVTKKKKVEICIELGVEMLIDDSPDYILECHEKNLPSLLFDAPWNQNTKLPSTAKRVKNWKEVNTHVNNLRSR